MTTKPCVDCGTAFKKSPADRTVRCPACRRDTTTRVKSYKRLTCSRCGTSYTQLRCPGCGF